MTEGVQLGRVPAQLVAREAEVLQAPNGMSYSTYSDTNVDPRELQHLVQAVPLKIAAALELVTYYFVPLALEDRESLSEIARGAETQIASAYTAELAEHAICHRNVSLGSREGVFISTRLLNDRFALSFEFFINVGHAFVDATAVPDNFGALVWAQAIADVRGETSHDSWDNRNTSLGRGAKGYKVGVDEEAKARFLECALADTIAIYLLSLAIDFEYSELREREYPLLAPQALAERLRLVASLFPPNSGYNFSIRYRRRA